MEGEDWGVKDLIARLEAAEGPDRELADEVLLACGWERSVGATTNPDIVFWKAPDSDEYHAEGSDWPGDPTASIDAALTLVPEKYDITITQASGPRRSDWFATCTERDEFARTITHKARDAATPALALCIAALKARA